jgi:membrane-associated PAP2 superfamily phosphatase
MLQNKINDQSSYFFLKTVNRRWLELAVLLALILITTPLFWLTDLDNHVSAWFFQNGHWQSRDSGLHWLLFQYGGKFIIAVAALALLVVVGSFFIAKFVHLRRPALYIFLVIVLGSGLVVNLIFKDHWGRPRPMHTQTFGGDYAYVPPLKMSNSPNKSFPSGHCSVSFSFFALYFLARKRKAVYLLLTLALGALMGWSRMAVGGHFFSDVLWSGYLMFLVSWLLYYVWYSRSIK